MILVSENDESRSHVGTTASPIRKTAPSTRGGQRHHPQPIPYTAVLRIEDRLTVPEMRSYILSRERAGTYLCEFRNIDRFLCAIRPHVPASAS